MHVVCLSFIYIRLWLEIIANKSGTKGKTSQNVYVHQIANTLKPMHKSSHLYTIFTDT